MADIPILVGVVAAIVLLAINICGMAGKKSSKIETLKRLRLKDGGIIILKHSGRLNPEAIPHIKKSISFIIDSMNLGVKVKTIVLDEGMGIEVWVNE